MLFFLGVYQYLSQRSEIGGRKTIVNMSALPFHGDTENSSNAYFNESGVTSTMINDVVQERPSVSSRGGHPGFGRRKRACGYCDITCVYNSIEMGFVIGIIANLIVIIRVARDKKLRDPTFAAIACLAVADAIFLTVNVTRSFDDVITTMTCNFPSGLISRPFYITQSMTWFAANAHVALMAILRYITIAYPLKSVLILTVKRVVMSSVCVWCLGIVLIGILAVLITYKIMLPGKSQEFIIILWTIVYLMPVCVTTILHLKKMCVVKKTTRDSATESTKRSVRRMSRIVVMVIIFATILPLPRLVGKILKVARVKFPTQEFATHYEGIADLLFLINHFINPFMYGFLSKRFRNSIKDMLWFIKFSVSESGSTDTSETPVSSRRQHISMEQLPGARKSSSSSSISSVSSVETSVKF